MSHDVQCFDPGLQKWFPVAGCVSRSYADGYMDAVASGPAPRLAYRIVKLGSDKPLRELIAIDDVSIGMVAGWPTAGQYLNAAARAIKLAATARNPSIAEVPEIELALSKLRTSARKPFAPCVCGGDMTLKYRTPSCPTLKCRTCGAERARGLE